jgi:oligoribonuclease NrnB/cAMP/cGMP phosphodiesterase (DHH superfamily)
MIYHDNCDDGFAAAWAAHKKWGDEIAYLPSNYGRPLPNWIGKGDILIADFSLPEDQCQTLVERGNRIVMLDHHKTAASALARMPHTTRPNIENVGQRFDMTCGTWHSAVLVEFDMNRSGARMAWDFAFPGEETPELILAVEDRDLWRFDRPDTKLVSMYLRSLDRDFAQWDAAAALYSDKPEQFLSEAAAIQRFYDLRIKGICSNAGTQYFHGHHGVAVTYACPYDFVSDACHTLLDMYPDAPFAVAVIQNQDGITYSLRSRDGRADVSEIAKANGGGGHRNAAGFRVSND